MSDLVNHIKARNARMLAWQQESPETRFIGIFDEDAAYWAQQGITTPEEFDRSMLIDSISDTYKMVNGFRPRHINYAAMSTQELEAYLESLHERTQLS